MLKKLITRVQYNARDSVSTSRRILAIVLETIWRFESTERRNDAAALTYTTLFALVPVLTVIYSILSAIPALSEWGGDFTAQLLSTVLPQGSEYISDYLLSFSQQARSLTWIGVVFLFVTSLTLLRTIERQFNRIWNVDTPRSGLQNFMRYWVVLTLGPVLVIGAIAASSVLASLPVFSDLDNIPVPIKLLPWALSTAAITAVYILVPNCRVPWKNALIAAMLISFCFEVGKYLFAHIVGLFPSYQLIYGAFAVVPLFLLWIYLAWMLLLIGAELSYALSHYAPANRQLPLMWRRLRLVQRLIDEQRKGRLLNEARLAKRLRDLTPVQVRVELHHLKQRGFVTLTQEGHWVWIADIEQLTLMQLFDDLTLAHLQEPLPQDIRLSVEQRQRWLSWQQDWLAQCEKTTAHTVASIL